MNVLSVLSDELSDKEWDIKEKTRYLYLRSCELFSYDSRLWLYEDYYDDVEYVEEIMNHIIDLENMIDNRVVCTSHAKALAEIYKKLLNKNCNLTGTAHAWIMFNQGKIRMTADGTISSDLARVKMSLSTKGYIPFNKNSSFDADIKEIDKKIGYIKEEYEDFYIKKRVEGLEDEFISYSKDFDSDEYFIYKIYTIKEMFEKYNLDSFSDCEFCISYLMKKMIEKDPRNLGTVNLFDGEFQKLINIYLFKYKDERIYFVLEKVNGKYCFYEITEDDAINYTKTLKGLNKKRILSPKIIH